MRTTLEMGDYSTGEFFAGVYLRCDEAAILEEGVDTVAARSVEQGKSACHLGDCALSPDIITSNTVCTVEIACSRRPVDSLCVVPIDKALHQFVKSAEDCGITEEPILPWM